MYRAGVVVAWLSAVSPVLVAYEQCQSLGMLPTRNYSNMDAVIVSIGVMCGTPDSARRLLHFYKFRRIFYILPHPELECPAIEAIDSRMICLGEQSLLGNTTMNSLKRECSGAYGNWSGASRRRPFGIKAMGWFVQQFVKLGAARLLDDLSEDYLVWDADNVLLTGQHELMTADGKVVLVEHTRARYDTGGYNAIAKSLLGFQMPRTPHGLNWVTGHMVFKRSYVREMLTEIEERYKVDWTTAVCISMAQKQSTDAKFEFFSEYQTYGAWLNVRHSDAIGRIETMRLVRNPDSIMNIVRQGECCVSEEAICLYQTKLNPGNSPFYLILEEHKWRVRDRVCKDNWDIRQINARSSFHEEMAPGEMQS